MRFDEKVVLGRTGLKVGRLGIASGYWAPAQAIEEAFEKYLDSDKCSNDITQWVSDNVSDYDR